MIPCAAAFRRSLMAWYFPLRLSSNTRSDRRFAFPSSSDGSPVNIDAYSRASALAASSTSSRKCSSDDVFGSSGPSGERGGSRSATASAGCVGFLHAGTSGLYSETSIDSVGGADALAHADSPSGGGSSAIGFAPGGTSSGGNGRTATADAATPSGGGSGRRSSPDVVVTAVPGSTSASRFNSHTARYAWKHGSVVVSASRTTRPTSNDTRAPLPLTDALNARTWSPSSHRLTSVSSLQTILRIFRSSSGAGAGSSPSFGVGGGDGGGFVSSEAMIAAASASVASPSAIAVAISSSSLSSSASRSTSASSSSSPRGGGDAFVGAVGPLDPRAGCPIPSSWGPRPRSKQDEERAAAAAAAARGRRT
mmetsp:Transcript_3429/g.11608  ORF Transcript_3429/g.11608 Transcript_3429/m.11608 type:complete len:365 (-) Transcript_3429:994-2088(-)